MRLSRVVVGTMVLLFGLASVVGAQTAFEQLFDPRTATSIILVMPQAVWTQIAEADPQPPNPGNPTDPTCYFGAPPSVDRFTWHKTDATVITERQTTTSQFYSEIGIKKKGFCGSFHKQKPSLTLTFDKTNSSNKPLAENQLGTTHLSLENSKQDPDLYRQCAGYYVFRTMGIPAPMCSFVALYRRDPPTVPPNGGIVFLGLYVMTEPVKKDFFRRRAGLVNVPDGSLYEFEAWDDFVPATLPQLLVEWPNPTQNQDFTFAANQVQAGGSTALAKSFDLPALIGFWASEIFLKSGDGFLSNTNNAFAFDDPPANPSAPISQTRFRFVPHGLDSILSVGTKPSVSQTSKVAKLALADNGLRYQLINTLTSMGTLIETADVPGHIESFVPLVVRLWRGPDVFFGADPNGAIPRAENVRRAAQQAIVDLRTVFGYGVAAPLTYTPRRLAGAHHVQCMTRVATNPEVRREACTNQPGQQWTFEPAATTMVNVGFQPSLKLYHVRNQGTNQCLVAGVALPASPNFKLEMANCNAQADRQRFLVVQREGRSFELRAFAEDRCAHFSDGVVTSDNRPAIYLGSCDGTSKNLIVTE